MSSFINTPTSKDAIDAAKPHAASHKTSGADKILPSDIGAATESSVIEALALATTARAKADEAYTLASTGSFPRGMIAMWSGTIATIPVGWALCNGTNGTPALQDKFIIGAGSAYGAMTVGGGIQHTHSAGTNVHGSTLTVGQLAWHMHRNIVGTTQGNGRNAPEFGPKGSIGYDTCTYEGSNEAHAHSAGTTVNAASSLPPYYALAFIMKL